MSEILDVLWKVQVLDREIFRFRRYQRQLPEETRQKELEVEEVKRAIQGATDRRLECDQQILHAEGDLCTEEDRIDRLKSQQLEVKTNREFKANQNEIALIEHEKSKIEDQILELLTRKEDTEAEIREFNDRCQGKEKELDGVRRRVGRDSEEIETKMGGLGTQRVAITDAIDPAALAVYEELLEAKDGVALCIVEEGVCQGCSFEVLPNVMNLLHRDSDLVQCSHCGRILCLKD